MKQQKKLVEKEVAANMLNAFRVEHIDTDTAVEGLLEWAETLGKNLDQFGVAEMLDDFVNFARARYSGDNRECVVNMLYYLFDVVLSTQIGNGVRVLEW